MRVVIAVELARHSRTICAGSTLRDALILHVRHLLLLVPVVVALIHDGLLESGRYHVLNVAVENSSPAHMWLMRGVDRFGLFRIDRRIRSMPSFILPQMLIVLNLGHQFSV